MHRSIPLGIISLAVAAGSATSLWSADGCSIEDIKAPGEICASGCDTCQNSVPPYHHTCYDASNRNTEVMCAGGTSNGIYCCLRDYDTDIWDRVMVCESLEFSCTGLEYLGVGSAWAELWQGTCKNDTHPPCP